MALPLEARESTIYPNRTIRQIRPDTVRSFLAPGPEFENFPKHGKAEEHILAATAAGASAAAVHIHEFTRGVPETRELPTQEKNRRVIILDKSSDA